MTYDPTDADDDGVVESDVDNQSTTTQALDTESTTITKQVLLTSEDGTEVYSLDGRTLGDTITTALDDLAAKSGTAADHGKLTLPFGVFDVSETIFLDADRFNSLTVEGRGGLGEAATKRGTALNSTISDGSDVLDTGEPIDELHLSGISVKKSGNDGVGIRYLGSDQGSLTNVSVDGAGDSEGLNTFGVSGDVIHDNIVARNTSVIVDSSPGYWRDVEIETSSTRCLDITGDKNNIEPNQLEGGTAGAFFRGKTNTIIGGEINTCDSSVVSTNNAKNNRVVDTTMFGSTQYSVNCWGGTGEVYENLTMNPDNSATAHIRIGSSSVAKDIRVLNPEFDNSANVPKFDITKENARDIHVEDSDFNGGTVTDGDSDNSISVSFDTVFTQRPLMRFGRRGGGINDVSFTTNSNGHYDGSTITIATAGATVDYKAIPSDL